LIKAIYYLIINVIERVKKDTFITMSAKIVMKDPPRLRISIEYSGEEITDGEKQNLLKPLLDINSLGTELNIPISYKIIEGHNGSINIESAKGTNTFIIDLPSINRRSLTVPTEEKRIE
jgi:nitrogen-specific signal transduction histidine kinase